MTRPRAQAPEVREYDGTQPVIHVPGWQPSPEILTKAVKMLHKAQSMRGRWMDMGERADYLLKKMPEISVGWQAMLLARMVDAVSVPVEEA